MSEEIIEPDATADESSEQGSGNSPRMTPGDHFLGMILFLYLVLVVLFAGFYLLETFEEVAGKPLNDKVKIISAVQLIKVALYAGMLGGFLHASASLSVYMAHRSFSGSWLIWYLLRPWQGAVVGWAMYVITRAGLISGSDGDINPFGVAALGLLGGWFSKDAMEKMKEVFQTLFAPRGTSDSPGAAKPQPGGQPGGNEGT